MRATIREIEASGRAMLASLDTSAYAPGQDWTPTRRPGDLLGDAASGGALLYDLRVVDGDPEARWTGPASGCGSVEQQRARILLTFSLPVSESDPEESWALAADAAEHALRALASPPWRARRVYVPRRRWAGEGAEVGASPAAPGARWVVTTCELSMPRDFALDPAVAQPPGSAPVVAVYIDGTPGPGAELTARPVLISGTTPVSHAFAWEVDGDAAGIAQTITLPDDWDGEPITVSLTTTGPGGLTGTATSQVLGGDGAAACDCEALENQINGLTTQRDALQAQVTTLTGQLATANGTITALNAQITELDGQIAALTAALIEAKGWRNIGRWPVVAKGSNVTVDGTTGAITITHPGDAFADPLAAMAGQSWVTFALQHPDGTSASGWPWGPGQVQAVSESVVGAATDAAMVLHSNAPMNAGSYAAGGGYVAQTGGKQPLWLARGPSATWTRAVNTVRAGLTGGRWSNGENIGANGGGMRGGTVAILPTGLTGNTAGMAVSGTSTWGSETAPAMTHVTLTWTGSAYSAVVLASLSPSVLAVKP